MSKTNSWIVIAVIIVAIILGAAVSYSSYKATPTVIAPGALDSFVQCIKDKNIVFYGAFWCPHCQRTKAEFGDSASKLPYVECSTPDGQHATQICIDKQIEEYPTWVLPDGTRLTGEKSLQELSDAFECPLPSGIASSTTPVGTSAASPAQ
jgi:thiol-disulfide isomerase/thioredoxin